MSSYTLGIDPGKKGAIAMLDPSGSMVWVKDAPLIGKELDPIGMLKEIHRALNFNLRDPVTPLFAVIEKPATIPGRSAGLLSNGIGVGMWIGMLTALCIPHEIVAAGTWQKVMLKGTNKSDGKQRARLIASRLFPGADLGKRKTEDRSDALLLAEYGRRLRGGEMREGE